VTIRPNRADQVYYQYFEAKQTTKTSKIKSSIYVHWQMASNAENKLNNTNLVKNRT
jgi:Mn-dependent DtxR family transcriptional regulator